MKFEEIITYGDKSVVDGVTVEMYSEFDRQLFWHSTYQVGDEPKIETAYSFYPTYQFHGDLVLGGFGIYSFTYDNERGTIDSEHIKMVYALDSETEIIKFQLDASGKNFLLGTVEDGYIYLSVISRETMTLADKFLVGNGESYFSIYSHENYMVLTGDFLMVYPMNENGRYEKAFEVDRKVIDTVTESYGLAQNIPDISGSFDWDGETLLFGDYSYYHEQGAVCEFILAAINEEGLKYMGVYRSTLYSDAISYACSPDTMEDKPVVVHWDK